MVKVKADFQNHFTTKSRVLNPIKVAKTVQNKLGKYGLSGLINYQDQRYEAFEKNAEGHGHNLGNAIYFNSENVIVVKGEEIPTADGDLLVVGTNVGKHLTARRTLEESLKEARDNNGITIITTPFYRSSVGEKLKKNPKLFELCDAVEAYNGLAGKIENEMADNLYVEHFIDYPHLGALASSDGHTFNEVGLCYTELEMPEYEEIKNADELQDALREAIGNAGVRQQRKSTYGKIEHAAIIGAMLLARKIGINLSRGDKEALR